MTDDGQPLRRRYVPTGRPRGRPRLSDEERAARLAEANLRSTRKGREGRVIRSLFLDEAQAERMERLMDLLGCTSAGALVDELIEAATASDPEDDDDA